MLVYRVGANDNLSLNSEAVLPKVATVFRRAFSAKSFPFFEAVGRPKNTMDGASAVAFCIENTVRDIMQEFRGLVELVSLNM